jgi:hypothetical protein
MLERFGIKDTSRCDAGWLRSSPRSAAFEQTAKASASPLFEPRRGQDTMDDARGELRSLQIDDSLGQ